MDKKEIANQIIACGRNGFGEDDRDSLLAMEEEILTKMVPATANQDGDAPGNAPGEGEGEGEGEGAGTSDEGEGGPGEGEGADNEGGEPGDESGDQASEGDGEGAGDGKKGQGGDESTDVVAFLEGKEAPPAMIEATRESIRVLKEEKDGIIKAIMDHGANTYSEEALRDKDIFDLRSISSLMGGNEEENSEEEEIPGDPKKVIYMGATGNSAHKKVANSDRDSKPLGRPGINRKKA